MKNAFYTIIIAIIILSSCREEGVMVPEFVAPDSDRVVLVEELTGVRCPNCPSGAAKIDDLLSLYEGQLVVVAVHGSFDTEPLEESKYDFRTEESIELEDYLKPFWGKPAAAINRIPRDGALAQVGIDNWGGYIEEELNKANVLNISVETEYNTENRLLTINMGFIPVIQLEGNYNYSVAITESHIIDAQLNQSTVIPEYEHNHVFRKMLTDVTGDPLGSDLAANELLSKKLEYNLPEDQNLWKPENCHVIVFVTEIEGDNKIVLQATEAKVVE